MVKSFLSRDDLKAVAGAIGDAEKKTSGEIRVAVRQKRERKERGLSVEQLARLEFARLGMEQTEGRSGVLILIVVEEREFFILADEGINTTVGQDTWNDIALAMAEQFRKKEFRKGIIAAVGAVGELLASHFPIKQGDRNELSNDVVVS